MIIILATQRPSYQVIDPSMRDLFGYRWAFRCTTDSSSDTVLGQGWASEGYTAADIDPLARGVGWLLSETGTPRRIKAAYLDDDTIKYLAAYAAQLRHGLQLLLLEESHGLAAGLARVSQFLAERSYRRYGTNRYQIPVQDLLP